MKSKERLSRNDQVPGDGHKAIEYEAEVDIEREDRLQHVLYHFFFRFWSYRFYLYLAVKAMTSEYPPLNQRTPNLPTLQPLMDIQVGRDPNYPVWATSWFWLNVVKSRSHQSNGHIPRWTCPGLHPRLSPTVLDGDHVQIPTWIEYIAFDLPMPSAFPCGPSWWPFGRRWYLAGLSSCHFESQWLPEVSCVFANEDWPWWLVLDRTWTWVGRLYCVLRWVRSVETTHF